MNNFLDAIGLAQYIVRALQIGVVVFCWILWRRTALRGFFVLSIAFSLQFLTPLVAIALGLAMRSGLAQAHMAGAVSVHVVITNFLFLVSLWLLRRDNLRSSN
jgi:hypothetical protein